jgi:hypothetical protein
MTEATTPIPASRIKGLRIVCRKCGVEVMLPISARDAPAQCFNCHTRFADGGGILSALRELQWLHDTDSRGESAIGFWIDPKP